jgi:hypothetical protein
MELPKEVRDYFREQGRIGGKLGGRKGGLIGGSKGGKIAAEGMTPEGRKERARKAGLAAAAARWAKKRPKTIDK